MHRPLDLPTLFLAISAGMVAIEAVLGSISLINARYRVGDTCASLGMQLGNILMNIMMAGIVFAGLTAVYRVRLYSIFPSDQPQPYNLSTALESPVSGS